MSKVTAKQGHFYIGMWYMCVGWPCKPYVFLDVMCWHVASMQRTLKENGNSCWISTR